MVMVVEIPKHIFLHWMAGWVGWLYALHFGVYCIAKNRTTAAL